MDMTSEEFNAKYPVGTPVVYQSLMGGEGVQSTTRTPAWDLGCGAAVVSIKGKSGGLSLEHITVISEEK